MDNERLLNILWWISLIIAILVVSLTNSKVEALTQTIELDALPTLSIVDAPRVLEVEDLGEFTITYYDADIPCTGKEDGITYSGIKAKEGITIAVDPSIIPLGSRVYIEGVGIRTAQDIGGAIKSKRIDVFVGSHKEALKLGKHKARVSLILGE